MEIMTNPMNKPDYAMDKSMEDTTANTVEGNEKREAICKACGAIWHPRKTDTRRPTRCPYCQSRRTDWLDHHLKVEMEQKTEPALPSDKSDIPDMEEKDSVRERSNSSDLDSAREESMEYAGINQDDAGDYTDDMNEDDESSIESSTDMNDTMAYAGTNPRIKPDYSMDYSPQKTDAVRIPNTVVFALVGAGLIYGIYRLWKIWKKPVEEKTEAVSTSQEVSIGMPHIGLTDMSRQMHSF